MLYGMCVGDSIERISVAARSGFDFVESCFSLLADKDDEYFERFREELEKYNIKCLSVNCFIPGNLKVTGPDVDYSALAEYIEKGMKRGKEIGLEKIVFGSGGARNVPDGWAYEDAYRQLIYFLKETVAPLASKYGLTVVLEPLRRGDSNIINSAFEGAAVVSAVDSDCIKCLVDLYHMETAGDDAQTVRALKGSIKHAHIAEPVNRHYPAPGDGVDYKSFIEALEYAGCETCAVEASTDDFNKDCAPSLPAIKTE